MSRKKIDDHGTGIPRHEVEALARLLLPEIQRFFESEEGQKEYHAWKQQQEGSPSEDAIPEDDPDWDDGDDDDHPWGDPFWDFRLDDYYSDWE